MVRMFVPDCTWLPIAQCFQLILLGLVAVRLREIRDKLTDRLEILTSLAAMTEHNEP
jgi:hypothetical protein